MWLDRLSGHSTPSATPPASRPYSPAPPRRPSHLAPSSAAQRPGFSPRSSSLSLVSNDSTTSLLASSKRVNGSALKQSVTTGDAPDPTKVLRRLIGAGSGRADIKNEAIDRIDGLEDDDGPSTAAARVEASLAWGSIFKPPPAPRCVVHREETRAWTVNKSGESGCRRQVGDATQG